MGGPPRIAVAWWSWSGVSYVLAGTFGGVLMALVSTTVGSLMLFFLVKEPSPWFAALEERLSPMQMTMGLVILGYPIWALLGGMMGMLYWASTEAASATGAGSPNLLFTALVVVGSVAAIAPFVALLRRVVAGFVALALCFAGTFGWLVPHMAG